MITEITLHNWKSIDTATLLVDQITFLIGTNASGKSNIVDALQFLSYLGSGMRLSDACRKIRGGLDHIVRRGCPAAGISLRFKTDKSEYRYLLHFITDSTDALVNAEQLDVVAADGTIRTLFRTHNPEFDNKSGEITVSVQKDRPGQMKQLTMRRDATIISQIAGQNVIKEIKDAAEAALIAFASIFVLDPNPALMRGFAPLSETLLADASNVAGVIAALPAKESKLLENQITAYVKGLPERDLRRVWAEKVGRFSDVAMIYCEEDWDSGSDLMEVDARSMSDGTLRFIAIITAMLTRSSDSLLVVEEIDNGLHPSRVGELVEAIRDIATRGDFDVVCTTHNPVLIDELPADILPSVSCVTREGSHGTTSITPLTTRPDFLRELSAYTPGAMMTHGLTSKK